MGGVGDGDAAYLNPQARPCRYLRLYCSTQRAKLAALLPGPMTQVAAFSDGGGGGDGRVRAEVAG